MPSGYGRWTGENSDCGLVVAVVLVLVVIGAGAAAVWFVLKEIWAYRVEWAAAACGFFAIMGTAGVLMYLQNRKGLPVDESAKAEAVARRLALPAAARPAVAAPVTVTHHHYDERQVTVVNNDQRQLHVQVAPSATEQSQGITLRDDRELPSAERPAIARRTVKAVVLARPDEARLRP